ncbi:MAG: hypothetical protein IJV71_04445 [Lachnospiraceae bacterium]|nr:hypothetical protein [Lachnospiraceae bacterium]
MKCGVSVRRVVAICMMIVMMMSLVACSCSSGEDAKANNKIEKEYTYNTYVMKGENPMDTVRKYTEIGLVDVQIAEDGTWEWVYEMAQSVTDVTAAYTEKEKWGIPADGQGRVWEIKLTEGACFEEGTPINADTYIESLKQVLDGETDEDMSRFTEGTKHSTAIVGAKTYSMNDMAGKPIYGTLSKAGYATVDKAIAGGVSADAIMLDVHGAFGIECDTETGMIWYQDAETQLVDARGALGQIGKKVTAKELYDQLFAGGAMYADYAKDYIYIPTGQQYQAVEMDTVGLVKVDEYTLYYITTGTVSQSQMYMALRDNWLIYDTAEPTEDEEEKDNIYVSYGPYKLISYRDKEIKLKKNERWYGYKDEKHEDQYQTTDIVVKVLNSQTDVIQMYESGQLDYVRLTPANMSSYAESPYKYVQDTEYVYRWTFATELDDLIALEVAEGQGNNKRVLYYDDFRKAMALSIDRSRICQIAGVNYEEANYLISSYYYTDVENDTVYRDVVAQMMEKDETTEETPETGEGTIEETPEAKEGDAQETSGAGNGVDGTESLERTRDTRDIEAAKALYQAVYTQAKLNKNYTDGQKIQINCIVGDYEQLTEHDKSEEKALNEMLAEATVGTGFEGMINITYMCSDVDRYRACASGEAEMIKSARGGYVYDPFTLIRCYTDASYVGVVHESCGWDPTEEKVTITYDFDGDGTEDTVAKTYLDWTRDIQPGGTYAANMTTRIYILSCVEQAILNAYQCIPWGTATEWSLISEKVQYGATSYNPMYEYGGVRHMKYSYDDKEWKKHIAKK